jgi:hypothetical protein
MAAGGPRMLDHLSPKECRDLESTLEAGEAWPRVIRDVYLRGSRLVLGIDSARSDSEIAAAAGIDAALVREAIRRAALWCVEHGLHLLGFPSGETPGEWRHFMAVG